LSKAVFLDRDGVINKKREDYVKNSKEFVLLNDVPQAIRLLNENQYLVILITNQSAINRGLISHKELKRIHELMKKQLEEHNCSIDAVYYCPHRPDENCNCRKPKTELLDKAIKDFGVDIKSSWFIGDDETDIQASKKIGIKFIKIKNRF